MLVKTSNPDIDSIIFRNIGGELLGLTFFEYSTCQSLKHNRGIQYEYEAEGRRMV